MNTFSNKKDLQNWHSSWILSQKSTGRCIRPKWGSMWRKAWCLGNGAPKHKGQVDFFKGDNWDRIEEWVIGKSIENAANKQNKKITNSRESKYRKFKANLWNKPCREITNKQGNQYDRVFNFPLASQKWRNCSSVIMYFSSSYVYLHKAGKFSQAQVLSAQTDNFSQIKKDTQHLVYSTIGSVIA